MKRVLLISNNALSTVDNNGKTYASILSNYIPASIFQIYFSEGQYENYKLCSNYLNVTDKQILKSLFPLNIFHQKSGKIQKTQKSIDSKGNSIINTLKKYITPFIRDFLWELGRHKYLDIINWVKEVKPDVIFLVSGPYNFPNKIARRISEEFKIPIVLYYTDDYVVNSIRHNIFYPLVKYRRKKFYKEIISSSSIRYVIGEEMARIYSDYFDTSFDFIMNSVDVFPFSSPKRFGEIINISYFGSLHSKRWESIIKLSKSVPENCIINIYTVSLEDSIKKELLKYNNLKLCGGVSGEKLTKAMLDSDFLLHVESNNPYYRRLTSLSVSTKIPEYLMASRPIIAFGPQEVASMKLLSTNRIGFPIDSDISITEIKKILKKILSDFSQTQKMAERGYSYVVNNFDRLKISQKVYNEIEKI